MKQWILLVLCFFSFLSAEFQAKDFSYLIKAMPEIHENLFTMHFKLYEGYVNQVNFLDQLCESMQSTTGEKNDFVFASIKRQYGFEFDGMRLHEKYFENLGGKGTFDPKSPLVKAIIAKFGSFAEWKKDFKRTAATRGIGWAILYYDRKTKMLLNAFVQDHDDGILCCGTPLIVCDLWEHAYITQFGLDRAKYVDVVLENINWKVVNSRYHP